ncbi:hypothetical protein PILCRDRAFT_64768, partial [Piloderma croceum F 1598]
TENFTQSADQKTDDDWVRLTSTDGFSFMVKRNVATASGTLKSMLSAESDFSEALSNTCPINERASVVEKVCEYMAFKTYYDSAGPNVEIPVNEFIERIPPEVALELYVSLTRFRRACLLIRRICCFRIADY